MRIMYEKDGKEVPVSVREIEDKYDVIIKCVLQPFNKGDNIIPLHWTKLYESALRISPLYDKFRGLELKVEGEVVPQYCDRDQNRIYVEVGQRFEINGKKFRVTKDEYSEITERVLE